MAMNALIQKKITEYSSAQTTDEAFAIGDCIQIQFLPVAHDTKAPRLEKDIIDKF